jgi:hypothetical protein
MENQRIFLSSILGLVILFSSISHVSAHPNTDKVQIDFNTHEPQTKYFPIDGIIGIEKTTMMFHAPEDNILPWGFVEGKIENPVAGYPVVIQIYKEGEAVHFAQTNVNENGNYEYKFRVLNVDEDKTTKIFSGDYNVSIFKVVYLDQNNLI